MLLSSIHAFNFTAHPIEPVEVESVECEIACDIQRDEMCRQGVVVLRHALEEDFAHIPPKRNPRDKEGAGECDAIRYVPPRRLPRRIAIHEPVGNSISDICTLYYAPVGIHKWRARLPEQERWSEVHEQRRETAVVCEGTEGAVRKEDGRAGLELVQDIPGEVAEREGVQTAHHPVVAVQVAGEGKGRGAEDVERRGCYEEGVH